MASPQTVTQLLYEVRMGRQEAFDELLPMVYDELRQLARLQRRGERSAHTLNTTALIDEAYLKLVDYRRMNWESAAHVYAIASQAGGGYQRPISYGIQASVGIADRIRPRYLTS